jgi:hypothetical protein
VYPLARKYYSISLNTLRLRDGELGRGYIPPEELAKDIYHLKQGLIWLQYSLRLLRHPEKSTFQHFDKPDLTVEELRSQLDSDVQLEIKEDPSRLETYLGWINNRGFAPAVFEKTIQYIQSSIKLRENALQNQA